jgi:hypothetical protein
MLLSPLYISFKKQPPNTTHNLINIYIYLFFLHVSTIRLTSRVANQIIKGNKIILKELKPQLYFHT